MNILHNVTHSTSNVRRLLSALFVTLSCLLSIASAYAATAYQHEIQVDFTFDTAAVTEKTVSGYRLYKNNTQVCEAAAVTPQTFTCTDSGETGTYSFTLTAVYSDGSESPHSAPFPFTFGEETSPPPSGEEPPPSEQLGTGSMAFTFNWDLNNGADITGYRFYLNDQKLCETANSAATSITCYANLLNTVMQFSMASVDSSGAESQRSNILTFNPLDYPELFLRKAVTFDWEYTDSSGVSGFKVYHNDQLVCETADPAARQLTCSLYLTATNAFKVTAVLAGGAESLASNSIVYAANGVGSGEPTPDPNAPLAAVITTSPGLTGQAPFSVSFNGSQSTGAVSSYAWDFGDGESASGATAGHTYQSAGSYTATLTVSDAGGATRQSTANITVTAPEPVEQPKTPPVAAISSSTAVGDAPLTVQFDGSGSTSAQPPIVSWSWDFGDGSSATGESASHAYTSAGTFTAELTVTDSAGLSAKASTPVIVTAPPVIVNKPPVASFTASTTSGKAPLAVTFDAAGSTDEDGTITTYVWSFGDGSTANGASVQHSFNDAADYTVSLAVTDDKGDTATASKTISVLPKDLIKLELQEVQADSNWQKIAFDQPFTSPVVVAGPPSFANAEPATVRVRNLTATGCEVRIEEWDYLDGAHGPETVSILVMEKGAYTLETGARLEAGTFAGTTAFKKITLQQAYSAEPAILTQVLTTNEASAVSGRLRNTGTLTSFEYKMQEQEKNKISHASETVGYIAWEPGKGEYAGLLYEAGIKSKSVGNGWYSLAFQSEFPDVPLLFAGIQTYVETNPVALRWQNMTKTAAEIKAEEEQSYDTETTHKAETVSYLAFGGLSEPADMRLATFSWNFDSAQEQTISGFRVYNNGQMICETSQPSDRELTCEFKLDAASNSFTIKAVELSGEESSPSNSLLFATE